MGRFRCDRQFSPMTKYSVFLLLDKLFPQSSAVVCVTSSVLRWDDLTHPTSQILLLCFITEKIYSSISPPWKYDCNHLQIAVFQEPAELNTSFFNHRISRPANRSQARSAHVGLCRWAVYCLAVFACSCAIQQWFPAWVLYSIQNRQSCVSLRGWPWHL